ncbi:MAG: hypothetical protein AAGD18_20355 [Actinomycetota bacterium]
MSELDDTMALGKPVLPVLMREGISESLLPEAVGRIHRESYVEADTAAMSRLVRAVEAIVARSDQQPSSDVNGAWWIALILFGLLEGLRGVALGPFEERRDGEEHDDRGVVSSVVWVIPASA